MKILKEIIIKPSKNKIVNTFEIPDELFAVPFRILIIAPSNSGKSVLLASLLSSDDIPYKKIFKSNIFMFSPTIHLQDPAFSEVKNIKEGNIYSEYNENILAELILEQEENIKKLGKIKCPHICIVMDDCVHELPSTKKNLLKKLFFTGRHFNISLIILSQMYKSIDKGLRINSSDIILFETGNNNELRAIGEESAIDPKEFIRIFKHATAAPYSFLVIHNKKPIKSRYQLRLSNYIYDIN